MGIRQLRINGDEILKKKAKPVKEITEGTLALLGDMWDTLQAANGVGLAAPQIGVLRRIVVMDVDDE